MPDVLRFVSSPLQEVRTQAVYWKTRWHDAWTLVPELWASERTWALHPTIPTARLEFRYGIAMQRDMPQFAPVFRARNRLRQYIKIEDTVGPIGEDDETYGDTVATIRKWYGVLDIELDAEDGPLRRVIDGGEVVYYASGQTQFVAYGLAVLLDQADCVRTRFTGNTWSAGSPYDAARAVPFRSGKNPNRAESASPTGYLFHDDRDAGATWSTKQAVKYLLANDTPRDHSGGQMLEWSLSDPDSVVPDWDRVDLEREGRTPWELLGSLLARQRLLGFEVRPEETDEGVGGTIRVVPCSLAGEAISLAGLGLSSGAEFVANPRQKILAVELDRGAQIVLKRTSADQFDQVRVVSGPRTSVATWSYIDATLNHGWLAGQETTFEAGGSGDPDYPGATEIAARMEWHQAARARDELREVFARFVIDPAFAGYVGDGTSGTADQVLMPSDANVDAPEPLAPDDRRFLAELPLLTGFDYSSASPSETGPAPHTYLPPFVLFRRVDYTAPKPRYRPAESIGLSAESEIAGAEESRFWTARTRVDREDGGLWVEVNGGWQEVIAKTDFARLPEDPQVFDDYREMLVTAAVPWSQPVEAIYPDEAPFGQDLVRILLVEIPIVDGDQVFRCDYVVPDTVIGIDAGGTLQRSPGGYIRDDRPQLRALARVAWEWYGQVRRALSYSTSLVNNALELGDYIVSTGDPEIEGDVHIDDVGSVVSEIRILSPLAYGEGQLDAPVPRIEYQSAYGELDVVRLAIGGGK